MSFFTELRRRNVTRVAMLYAVAAWVILQVAELLFEALEVPGWGIKLVLGILVVFFPMALIFSWVYELTPEGLRRERDVDREASITPRTGRRINMLIVALLVAAIGMQALELGGVGRGGPGAPPSAEGGEPRAAAGEPDVGVQQESNVLAGEQFAPPPDRSIAVLPFATRSEEESDIHFVDGMHDEVLTRLSQIGALKVISRTSVMEYRDTVKNMRTIGDELQVGHLVEGSVQRAGSRIRVNVQLIRASTDEHVWAEIYDREMAASNLFEVQSDIARAVAAALSANLTDGEQRRLASIPTEDDQAYEEYLLGKREMARRTVPALASARAHFQAAVDRDPGFALAHVGLADATYLHAEYSNTANESVVAEAKRHAERALSLDADLAEAYASLGNIYNGTVLKDAAAAEAAFRRAIDLNPNYPTSYHWYSILLRAQGRLEEGAEMLEHALALDPLSPIINYNVGTTLEEMGRFDEAMAVYQRFHRLRPREPRIIYLIGLLNSFAYGRPAEAISWYRRAESIDPHTPNVQFALAMNWALVGETERLLQLADEERATDPDGPRWRRYEATYLMYHGRLDEAEPLVRELLELQPKSAYANWMMNWLDLDAGRYDEVIRRVRELAPELAQPGDPVVNRNNFGVAGDLAVALHRAGDEEQARALYQAVLDLYADMPRRGFSGYWYFDVILHALMGHRDAALSSLTRGIDEGMFQGWPFLLFIPETARLLEEPDFAAQMARIRARMDEQRVLALEIERKDLADAG